ncbi:MAG: hypothetical protein F6K10_00530 [Moorea sp. SIO2B7]|nr:hypothetical protein [Moorena sp. SIO2B7]
MEHFTLITPDGKVFIDQENSLKKPYRSWMGYVGKRNNPQRPIIRGVWRGEYELKRGDRVVFQVAREVEVK